MNGKVARSESYRMTFRMIVIAVLLLAFRIDICWSTAPSDAPPIGAIVENDKPVYYYTALGVAFVLKSYRHGGIEKVYIFPGNRVGGTHFASIGHDEIIPGVGAFGVRLGSSPSDVLDLHTEQGIWSTSTSPDFPIFLKVVFSENRALRLTYSDKALSQIVAAGRFRTPEGITQSSSAADLWEVYGEPDVFWYPHSGLHPRIAIAKFLLIYTQTIQDTFDHSLVSSFLIYTKKVLPLPLLIFASGVCAGFFFRKVSRRRTEGKVFFRLFLPSAVLGGIILMTSIAGYLVVITRAQLPYQIYIFIALPSFICGFVCTGLYSLLYGWGISIYRNGAILGILLLGSVTSVGLIVQLFTRFSELWASVWLGLLFSLYSIGLLTSKRWTPKS